MSQARTQHRIRLFVCALLFIPAAAVGAPDVTAAAGPVSRFQSLPRRSIELGADLSFLPSSLGPAAIVSPDGTILVLVAKKTDQERPQLYVRSLDQSNATPLAGTEGADSPFFSPDGKWIGFFADGSVKRIAVAGGNAVTICSACSGNNNARGGSWAEDGNIFFAPIPRAALRRVSSAGGVPEPLTQLDAATGEVAHRWPQALLGGKAVMFTANNHTADFEDASIVVQWLPDGPRKIVHRGGYYGRYLESGQLVFVRGGTLFAAPFDIRRLETIGEPVPTLTGIGGSSSFGGADLSISSRGAVAFVPGSGIRLVVPIQWMDRQGAISPRPLRSVPALYNHLRFSPDGRKLAMDIREDGKYNLWVYEWERDMMLRLTEGAGQNRIPVWAPDGERIAFASTRRDNAINNLYWQHADRTGDAELLLESENDLTPTSWHPSGKFLAYDERSPQTGSDIKILGVEDRKPAVFLATPFEEGNSEISPDGRWLAYHSNESGKLEVYVRPFPGPGEKQRVSVGDGMYPAWSRNSQELYYQNAADWTLRVAAYTTEGASFRAKTPEIVATIPRRGHGMPGFAIHPDGRRIALLKAVQESTDIRENHVTLVPDFAAELRRSTRRRR